VVLGDDLGSENYLSILARMDFCDVPVLKKYGIKPFVFGEAIYYPPAMAKGREWCRGGMGYGISIPLPVSDMFTLQIYQNAFILNAKHKGDVARTTCVEIEIGFF
jgi:hypothetical protein